MLWILRFVKQPGQHCVPSSFAPSRLLTPTVAPPCNAQPVAIGCLIMVVFVINVIIAVMLP
jgi:hypothetical protein